MVRRIAKRSADMALWRKCVLSKGESLHGMDQVATLAEAGLDPVGHSRGVEMEHLSLGQDFSRTHSRQPGVSDVRNLRGWTLYQTAVYRQMQIGHEPDWVSIMCALNYLKSC
jgi:hypothetical protein